MSAQERRITNRSEDAHDANGRLARAAETYRFVSRVPMFCERYYRIRRDPGLYLTAPEHRLEGADPVERGADLLVQRFGA